MNEQQMNQLIQFVLDAGGDDAAVISLEEIAEVTGLKSDKAHTANLLEGLAQSGILQIKWKKNEEYCLSVLPKGKMFLKEKSATHQRDAEIKISVSGKKLFWWSFLGALCASSIVAIVAILIVKLL